MQSDSSKEKYIRKAFIAIGAMAAVAALVVLQRPVTTEAAITSYKITSTFSSVTRNGDGKATAVTIVNPYYSSDVIPADGNPEPATLTFTITRASIIKDKQGLTMNSKYLAAGDNVTVWTTGAESGNLIKIVDRSVWRATLTGTTSEVNDEAQTFGVRVDKRISEISQNATYSLTGRGQAGTTIRQVEVKKTGNVTTRTNKTKAWADINAGQLIQLTGYWNAVGKFITATHIQLPKINVS